MQDIQLKVRTQGKIDNAMTMHMKVLVTLGKARENKKNRKHESFMTWEINFYLVKITTGRRNE